MNNKIISIGLLITVVIAIGGYFYPKAGSFFGAASGVGHFQMESFLQGLTAGGRDQFKLSNTGVLTTSVAATLGSSGTAVNQLNYGSCNLQPDATTIAATSTARVTCHGGSNANGQVAFTPLTGITSSSKIIGMLSTTTAAAGKAIGSGASGGLDFLGATASTTSGFIEILLMNNTGATYTWPTSGSASGTMQYIGIK